MDHDHSVSEDRFFVRNFPESRFYLLADAAQEAEFFHTKYAFEFDVISLVTDEYVQTGEVVYTSKGCVDAEETLAGLSRPNKNQEVA